MPLRPGSQILERDRELGLTDGGVLLAEERAERLALELLAPEEETAGRLPEPAPWSGWLPLAEQRLVAEFGLPQGIARAYARRLAPRIDVAPSFLERLSGLG